MNMLRTLQIFEILAFNIIIGFPLLIMNVKEEKWKKEFKTHIRYRIPLVIFNALLLTSLLLFDRITLLTAYLLFALPPVLTLFSYQLKAYKETFSIKQVLKENKTLPIMLILAFIALPVTHHFIANELLSNHESLTIETLNSKEINPSEYNQYKMSTFYKENPSYFESFNKDNLSVSQRNFETIILKYEWNQDDIYFSYHLEKAYWKLNVIIMHDDY